MINILEEEKELTIRKVPCPLSEILDFKRIQASKQAEEKF
jgi:hypothetical protein